MNLARIDEMRAMAVAVDADGARALYEELKAEIYEMQRILAIVQAKLPGPPPAPTPPPVTSEPDPAGPVPGT